MYEDTPDDDFTVAETLASIFDGECCDCGGRTRITRLEGIREFLQTYAGAVNTNTYTTRVWPKPRGDSDGLIESVCTSCGYTHRANHLTSQAWRNW